MRGVLDNLLLLIAELITSFDNFSEDIDMALNYRFFVEKLDNNTQLKNLRKKIRKFIID